MKIDLRVRIINERNATELPLSLVIDEGTTFGILRDYLSRCHNIHRDHIEVTYHPTKPAGASSTPTDHVVISLDIHHEMIAFITERQERKVPHLIKNLSECIQLKMSNFDIIQLRSDLTPFDEILSSIHKDPIVKTKIVHENQKLASKGNTIVTFIFTDGWIKHSEVKVIGGYACAPV